jgi:hypothetical protein
MMIVPIVSTTQAIAARARFLASVLVFADAATA